MLSIVLRRQPCSFCYANPLKILPEHIDYIFQTKNYYVLPLLHYSTVGKYSHRIYVGISSDLTSIRYLNTRIIDGCPHSLGIYNKILVSRFPTFLNLDTIGIIISYININQYL
jgi:hypothetical protein